MSVEPTELRTDRLLLRPYRLEDLDDVLAYATQEEWARYLYPVPHPYTRRHGEEFLAQRILAGWDTRPAWAIVLDGKVIGGVGLKVDAPNSIAELGYSLAPEHWGKGITVEAARAVIEWGFSTYDLAKIFAWADQRNVPSWRVMEKLGMTREGLLRSQRAVRDGRGDDVVYGLLREDWNSGTDPAEH